MAGTAEQPLHLAAQVWLLRSRSGSVQLWKVMPVAQRMVHALHREVPASSGRARRCRRRHRAKLPRTGRRPRSRTKAQPVAHRGRRAAIPLGPPADTARSGLVHRALTWHPCFTQVADHLDDAFEAPGTTCSRPIRCRRRRRKSPGRRANRSRHATRPDDHVGQGRRSGSATGRPRHGPGYSRAIRAPERRVTSAGMCESAATWFACHISPQRQRCALRCSMPRPGAGARCGSKTWRAGLGRMDISGVPVSVGPQFGQVSGYHDR